MASTVYNGSVVNNSITHTNSSGKNERILIYYLESQSPLSWNCVMTAGYLSFTLNNASNTGLQVWGLNLAINTYTGNASSMTNHMTVKSNDGTATGLHLPLELYISDGQIFRLSSAGPSADIRYNFVVITED